MAAVLIIGIVVFTLLGVPIGYVLGISSMLALMYQGNLPLIVIPQKIFTGIDSFPILAIPFFILAGNLMTVGGINKKIIAFANSIAGWITGSLAIVTVVASMFFAAISGSAVATVSAVGGLTIPAMKKEGYSAPFAGAVASSAAVCGPIIPPSIPLIVYGAALGMSISDLFIGALLPGILLGIILCATAYIISKKHGFPRHDRASASQIIKTAKEGLWALIMPLVILGGIFGGVFTPTEASVVAVVYALIVGFFVYKDLKPKDLHGILVDAAIGTSVIMIILATSKVSSWIVVTSHLPDLISGGILDFTSGRVGVLLLVNLILLVVGCLMEANAAIVILTPVLVPLVAKVGMTPLHFGVVMTFNLCLGLLTPPVGASILIGNDIAQEKMERTVAAAVPFFLVGLVILALITFIPALVTYLPNILF
ncbi:MAG: TRAP transporter large permease [Peptococcaceae bacterium]|jgi:C4-dicarboxylate transporter DctM subunit|nr:TRAP transporter large permease [Peptococcaceae bacterium]